MTQYSDAELGRALEGTPASNTLNKLKPWSSAEEELESSYEDSLENKPDRLVLHGSPASYEDAEERADSNEDLSLEEAVDEEYSKIRDRYETMKSDAENIVEQHGSGGVQVDMFEQEYKVLDEVGELEYLEDDLGLNIDTHESDQAMAWDDWDVLEDGTDEEVRSYTSASNRDKLQSLADQRFDDASVTVFGTPEFGVGGTARHYALNPVDTFLQRREWGRDQIRREDSMLNRTRSLFSGIF